MASKTLRFASPVNDSPASLQGLLRTGPRGAACVAAAEAAWRPVVHALFILLFMTGCAVGPDFTRPEPPAVTRYTHGQAPQQTPAADGQAQIFEIGAAIAEDWWRLFNSRELDAVVRKAIDENPNLQSALARLRQSRDNLRAGYGVFFPHIDASFQAMRERFSAAEFGVPGQSSLFNLYTLNGTVTYVLDVFGGQRRTVENLAAQVEQQKQTARAACLALVGNVINASVAGAAYRAEIEATEEIIALQKKQLKITENQARAGTVPYSSVLAVKAQLAATEATLPPLQKSLSQAQHLLTALAGQTPEQWEPPPLALADFTLPVQLPVSLPSEMTRRRPDILTAEAQLHAASANIGVATAALFPSFTLNGNYGQTTTDITSLFTPGANIWSIGSNLAAPIFHGGTLWFQRRAAIDAYQASLSDYRQAVVAAFQQVADSLRALEFDAETLAAQSESFATAARTLGLIETNHEAGLVNDLQVLTARIQYRQAWLGLVQAQAQRLQDTTALFVALGGGWWEPQDTGAPPKRECP
jgi:NodT family efflux transporter outer membrane factor (OMF) lipoprotein